MVLRASHFYSCCPFTTRLNEETILLSTYQKDGLQKEPVAKDSENNNDDHSKHKKITVWEAIVNVTNTIQGVVIINHPYALMLGGYWAIVTMIVVAYVSCYTGKALIRCLYEETDQGKMVRVRNSYGEVGQEVFGQRFGGKIVNSVLFIQMVADCAIFLVFPGMLLNACFPDFLNTQIWIAICGLLMLPSAYMKAFKNIYWISLGKVFGIAMFCLIFSAYCFTKIDQWNLSTILSGTSLQTVPLYYGIITFSYGGNPYYPTVEDNLQDPDRYNFVINICHFTNAVLRVVFSVVAFLTFGMHTEETVTNNIPIYGLKIAVNLFMVMGTLLTYPMFLFVVIDTMENQLVRKDSSTVAKCCQGNDRVVMASSMALRTATSLLTIAIAVGVPHFVQLVSVIGSLLGTIVDFVWPCTFHLQLKWRQLRWYQKLADFVIIILSVGFGGASVYYSFEALVLVME